MSMSSEEVSAGSTLDDSSSAMSNSIKSTATGDTTNGSSEKDEQLAQAETRAVFRLRILVIMILLLAAAFVSVFVYVLTSKAEDDQFHAQFEGSGTIVLVKFENILKERLAAITTLSVTTIAHSIDHVREWPFISLSSIQERFAKTNQIAGSMYLEFNPVVAEDEKDKWRQFTNTPADRKWIKDGLEYQEKMGLNVFDEMTADDPLNEELVGSYNLTYDTPDGGVEQETGHGPYLSVWQTSPVLRQDLVNKNLNRDPVFAKWANITMATQSVVIGGKMMAPPGFASHPDRSTQFFATILSMNRMERTMYLGDPMTNIFIPVFDSFDEDRNSVATLRAVFHWMSYFKNILPPHTPHMNLVLDNSCDGSYTYVIHGPSIDPVGEGDLHDRQFESMEMTTSFEGLENIGDGTVIGLTLNQDECKYSIRVYPTQNYHDEYHTGTPQIMTIAVAAIFVFTTCMFCFYDRLVERRQSLVLRKATQSGAIVSSLFPKNVRERLMGDNEADKKRNFMAPNHRLKNFLGGDVETHDDGARAIADLFPHCTVLFADIVGFTAWSSARDPTQVFDLLETIYQSFDSVAKRRRVFKVETIGDCYLAVTGLPDPQPDHALIMCKFAGECRLKLTEVTRRLEVTLGPDTGELGMRFGLHSGPVTAGVLRGDRSRFQLFGDTVNTAARMESTGANNRIHISQSTSELLNAAGKGHWVEPRKDAVKAKGKGLLSTFWMEPHARRGSMASSNADHEDRQEAVFSQDDDDLEAKENRRIDWIAGLLEEHIKRVVARRNATRKHNQTTKLYAPKKDKIPLDEVEDKIKLSNFNKKVTMKENHFSQVILDPEVTSQLRNYVADIAAMYRKNPFHNFEHACHVTMSVIKLLKRIAAPELDVEHFKSTDLASQLHDYTYGITSDPLATLAIIFSALIHDVDHRGVGNAQLIKEAPEISSTYRNKSIAEQISLDVAWDILMRPNYSALRNVMFANKEEYVRFRQVIVNVVLATDIFDKELNAARKGRWESAFAEANDDKKQIDGKDLKATIVIEHIIQASDVAHTMQHWHIYRRWNERLFLELSLAYRAGRMGADPATFWYQGELGFFDNYIIPLAKKLKNCGVFGVSSDEYLNYATLNREEWKEKGEEIVKAMVEQLNPIVGAVNTDLNSCGRNLSLETEFGLNRVGAVEAPLMNDSKFSTRGVAEDGTTTELLGSVVIATC